MELFMRRGLENFIIDKAVERALELGFCISVNDGEETVLKRSRSVEDIRSAMFSTDEDYFYFYASDDAKSPRVGWVRFIYGNSGYDVISDYSDNPTTEDILATANSVYDAYHDGKLEVKFSFKEEVKKD